MKTHAACISLLGALTSSCSTQDVTGAAEGAAMVALAPLGPAVAVVQEIKGTTHVLSNPDIYRISESTYAIWNASGWFTDQSERSAHQSNMSAWVIDVTKEKKDEKGRIVLSEANLDRWFFRDHSRKTLQAIPEEPPVSGGADYYKHETGTPTVTLCTKEKVYVFFLKQK